jgi:AraC-like DNA-binding protein
MRLKGIKPALDKALYLGLTPIACLENTGISLEDITAADGQHKGIQLEQEFTFYENILRLSNSPYIGLELGTAYHIETLGVLGYAQMTAKTLEDSIKIATNYSPLTLSYFKPVMIKQEFTGGLALEKQYEIPDRLLQIFSDRAVSAALTAMMSSTGLEGKINKILLMHTDNNHQLYEKRFKCDVSFGHHRNEIHIDRADLSLAMPKSDPEFSRQCLEQCRKLLGSYRAQSEFISSIKEFILSEPGYFPKANEVAEKLGYTPRTLRRKLSQEGEHYQSLINQVRADLAKNYLKSNLPIDSIAEILGFSEAAAFSNAFKTWESLSPSEYRKQLSQAL